MKRTTGLLAAFSAFVPMTAFAAIPSEIWIHCGNLPGCNNTFKEYVSGALLILLVRLPTYIYGLAVLFVMVGGAFILLSIGNSERVTKGKNTIIWAVVGIFVANFAETIIRVVVIPEVGTRAAGSDLVTSIIMTFTGGGGVVGSIFQLMYIAILGVAVGCGMWMVLSMGKEEQFSKAREGLFYAAVGAVIINLAQVLVNAFITF